MSREKSPYTGTLDAVFRQPCIEAASGQLRRTVWWLEQPWTWTWEETQEPAQLLAKGIHDGRIAVSMLWKAVEELGLANVTAGEIMRRTLEDLLAEKFHPGVTPAGRVLRIATEAADRLDELKLEENPTGQPIAMPHPGWSRELSTNKLKRQDAIEAAKRAERIRSTSPEDASEILAGLHKANEHLAKKAAAAAERE